MGSIPSQFHGITPRAIYSKISLQGRLPEPFHILNQLTHVYPNHIRLNGIYVLMIHYKIINALGVIPENCTGSNHRKVLWECPWKLLQERSQKIALGVIPENCSRSDPRKLLWEWSQKTSVGVIPETCFVITPRHLSLGVVPETSSGSDPIVVLYHPNPDFEVLGSNPSAK